MKKKGFTLIEILVVIGIISISLPVLFNIFYALVRQQVKINRLTEVKRQGDYILNIIKTLIINQAISIHNNIPPSPISCSSTQNITANNYFLDRQGTYFRFCQSSSGTTCDNSENYIASSSSLASVGTVALNNNKTLITNFSLTCFQNQSYSPPLIGIQFTICYKISPNQNDCNIGTRPEETAKLTYSTFVKLRSY